MTIEKQLEVLRESLEKSASVSITFHGTHGFSKQEANDLADELADKLGVEAHKPEGYAWFESNSMSQVNFTVHYNANKEEKIRLLEEKLAELNGESA